MSAPEKNQNAVKGESGATSFLHMRATPQAKVAWVKAANRKKKKLAEWATEALNREAGYEPPQD